MKTRTRFFQVVTFTALLPLFAAAYFEAEQSDQQLERIKILQREDAVYSRLFERFGDPEELLQRFRAGLHQDSIQWEESQRSLRQLSSVGTTKSLTVLPLIDWYTVNDDLVGESAVSYLIRTEEATILFDVGANPGNEDPSPLMRNLDHLGIDLDQVDIIVISHPHGDHTGGSTWLANQTFSLTGQQIDLGNIRAYVPVPMTYPGTSVVASLDPVALAPGVATTGVITNHCFFLGPIPEQAVAVNVEGLGIVVISGCGHQTVVKLFDRVELLFEAPVKGFVGGLHYPITKGRNIDLQRFFGTGKIPGEIQTMEEVQTNIDFLKAKGLRLIAISPHDSCDASIEAFKAAFPAITKDLVVGREISFSSAESM
ncbi:MAG: MBL fold metallo-hydrolase [Acidobacteriota bacterium]|nr:MAG: MBL fold metallo-hydrolase [Acidobacteriota bacterium]